MHVKNVCVYVCMLIGVGNRLYSSVPGSDLKYRNGSVAIGNTLFGPSVFAPHAFAKRSAVHYSICLIYRKIGQKMNFLVPQLGKILVVGI